jgi:hypothetical protein
MSESEERWRGQVVTGVQIQPVWVVKYPSGGFALGLYETEAQARATECVQRYDGTPVKVAVVVPSDPAPTQSKADHIGDVNETIAPWPPKWGEGPISGWCREKSTQRVHLWRWARLRQIDLMTVDDWGACTPDEFAAEFEPL